ncbi:MAG: 16S rRNA (uracil1498-N3)-methyltransferase [Halieaceae bacterium]|jgi:16S rRNA (uracil1498-N3)-methyltransferase
MRRPRFFSRESPGADGSLTLQAEPSRHIAKALRMQPGDALYLFDGSGQEYAGSIESVARDRVTVSTGPGETIDRESPLRITLAIALSRGDRMDLIVQKATELGVQTIWPVLSERTGVRLDAQRLAKKRGHWERIAISACEQCGRNRLPDIDDAAPLARVLEQASGEHGGESMLRLIMHPTAGESILPAASTSLCLLVGPEGGFSDGEVDQALAAGFQSLQLGPRILRTETAPIAAISMLQARWGDLLS